MTDFLVNTNNDDTDDSPVIRVLSRYFAERETLEKAARDVHESSIQTDNSDEVV